MKLKNILQLYALLICAISTVILILCFGLSFNSVTNLIIPEYKNYSLMSRYESNEAYIKFRENELQQYFPSYGAHLHEKPYREVENEIRVLRQLSPHDLGEKRLNAKKEFLDTEKRKNIQDLIVYFQWIIVAVVFYYSHWRLYKKATIS